MLLAEMSETVWLAIVAGVMLVVKQLLDWAGMYFKFAMDRKIAADLKTQAIKEAQKVTDHLRSQDMALDVVMKQTNGLIGEIKEKARKEGVEIGEREALKKLGKDDLRQTV